MSRKTRALKSFVPVSFFLLKFFFFFLVILWHKWVSSSCDSALQWLSTCSIYRCFGVWPHRGTLSPQAEVEGLRFSLWCLIFGSFLRWRNVDRKSEQKANTPSPCTWRSGETKATVSLCTSHTQKVCFPWEMPLLGVFSTPQPLFSVSRREPSAVWPSRHM